MKMGSRIMNKSMDKFLLLICFLVINACVVYFYILSMYETIKSVEWDKVRCTSELTSTKNRLDVVTEYKNKVDKMLAETQKLHNNDKNEFKDTLDTLIGIKQQSLICQKQFEELQEECKKAKKSFYDVNSKHNQLKDHTAILEQKNEKLQTKVLELIERVDELNKENTNLNDKLQNEVIREEFPIKTYLDRSFSKQIEESEGVYKIDIHSNADTDAFAKFNSTVREQVLSVN